MLRSNETPEASLLRLAKFSFRQDHNLNKGRLLGNANAENLT
jgi:hypothetical protein